MSGQQAVLFAVDAGARGSPEQLGDGSTRSPVQRSWPTTGLAPSPIGMCERSLALRGSVILARAVIEATCKEKGITEGVLATKIDELATQRFIRPDTQEAAHEIRHFGNDMAHGDFVDPVGEDEADDILSLMDEVLDEVFQGPAKIARVKANRLAKKAAKRP